MRRPGPRTHASPGISGGPGARRRALIPVARSMGDSGRIREIAFDHVRRPTGARRSAIGPTSPGSSTRWKSSPDSSAFPST